MTYEERIHKVSRQLHAAGTGYAPYKEVIGNLYWRGAAKQAIELQVEAIREFCIQAELTQEGFPVEQYLKQNGYIPEKEEE